MEEEEKRLILDQKKIIERKILNTYCYLFFLFRTR